MFRDRIRTTRNAGDRRSDWYRFENKADDETAIYIYDEISWWGISADRFVRDLRAVTSKKIALHLNSPGGDVFDGIAIYNALKQHTATVNVTVDGIAASIASVIAMAGDSVAVAKAAMFMIHEPFAFVIGDAKDMRKQADALDLMGDSIAGIYAARAGGNVEFWRGKMADETWYGDQAAVDAGLADALVETPAAKNEFDLSIFRNYRPAPASPAAPDAAQTTPSRANDGDSSVQRAALLRVAAAQLEVARCRP